MTSINYNFFAFCNTLILESIHKLIISSELMHLRVFIYLFAIGVQCDLPNGRSLNELVPRECSFLDDLLASRDGRVAGSPQAAV